VTEFRDAIAAAVHLPGVSEANRSWLQANDVLAMPEMIAIRRALRADDEWCCVDCFKDWAEKYDLPESVIAWVLDGDQ
jgi:hypothetical protein